MFRFFFPRQAQRIAKLEKQNADFLAQIEELYRHLNIHRAYVNETPARYELREGAITTSTSGGWPMWTTTTWPPNMGSTASTPPVNKPAKKRRKRKK